eukprot:ctg_2008.g553
MELRLRCVWDETEADGAENGGVECWYVAPPEARPSWTVSHQEALVRRPLRQGDPATCRRWEGTEVERARDARPDVYQLDWQAGGVRRWAFAESEVDGCRFRSHGGATDGALGAEAGVRAANCLRDAATFARFIPLDGAMATTTTASTTDPEAPTVLCFLLAPWRFLRVFDPVTGRVDCVSLPPVESSPDSVLPASTTSATEARAPPSSLTLSAGAAGSTSMSTQYKTAAAASDRTNASLLRTSLLYEAGATAAPMAGTWQRISSVHALPLGIVLEAVDGRKFAVMHPCEAPRELDVLQVEEQVVFTSRDMPVLITERCAAAAAVPDGHSGAIVAVYRIEYASMHRGHAVGGADRLALTLMWESGTLSHGERFCSACLAHGALATQPPLLCLLIGRTLTAVRLPAETADPRQAAVEFVQPEVQAMASLVATREHQLDLLVVPTASHATGTPLQLQMGRTLVAAVRGPHDHPIVALENAVGGQVTAVLTDGTRARWSAADIRSRLSKVVRDVLLACAFTLPEASAARLHAEVLAESARVRAPSRHRHSIGALDRTLQRLAAECNDREGGVASEGMTDITDDSERQCTVGPLQPPQDLQCVPHWLRPPVIADGAELASTRSPRLHVASPRTERVDSQRLTLSPLRLSTAGSGGHGGIAAMQGAAERNIFCAEVPLEAVLRAAHAVYEEYKVCGEGVSVWGDLARVLCRLATALGQMPYVDYYARDLGPTLFSGAALCQTPGAGNAATTASVPSLGAPASLMEWLQHVLGGFPHTVATADLGGDHQVACPLFGALREPGVFVPSPVEVSRKLVAVWESVRAECCMQYVASDASLLDDSILSQSFSLDASASFSVTDSRDLLRSSSRSSGNSTGSSSAAVAAAAAAAAAM